VYCTHCGSTVSGDDAFCRKCGVAQSASPPHAAVPVGAPQSTASVAVAEPASAPAFAVPLAVAGFFVGGFIGFSMRPSALIVGQLPFGVVVTRGASLTGLDQLLRPTAETSFNQMVTAAVVGAFAGVVIGLVLKALPARRG
jgi:hypothetical protein